MRSGDVVAAYRALLAAGPTALATPKEKRDAKAAAARCPPGAAPAADLIITHTSHYSYMTASL
jgi:hypothetical protein